MIGTLLRVLLGFALATVAAGAALVLHADTPSQIITRTGGAIGGDELATLGALMLKAATHIAIFAAPFALIVAAIAEWQRLRSMWFYLLAGLAIAAGGFMAQHASEAVGQQTVLNEYAVRAFAIAGLAAGLIYWLVAGRNAGGPGDDEDFYGGTETPPPAERAGKSVAKPAASEAPTANPPPTVTVSAPGGPVPAEAGQSVAQGGPDPAKASAKADDEGAKG